MNKRIKENHDYQDSNPMTTMKWCVARIKRLESALTYAMNPNTWGLPAEKWLANIGKRAIEGHGGGGGPAENK